MLLKNARVINPSAEFDGVLDIRIENDLVVDLAENLVPFEGEILYDFSGKIITPGLIDIHCHLREPGFTSKETIKSGIDSAIAGGYTAICPMANTSPAVDNLMTLKYVIEKAKEASDIGFYPICALTKNLDGQKIVNVSELVDNGAIAFSDDGKPLENMKLLAAALEYVDSLNSIVISHAEDSSLASGGVINQSYVSSKLGLKGIPSITESVAIARELEVVRSLGVKYHFAHISTRRSVELIRQAKKDGLKVTCETAPHYFSLTHNDIVHFDARFKMNPPLRSEDDLLAIIEGVEDGTIDVIATDHAPHTIEEKMMPIQTAPMGIVGFETALGLAFTKLVHQRKISIIKVIEKFTLNPSKILNIKDQGNIQIGSKANLTVIDPDLEWVVDSSKFKSKCKITPFEGIKLKGKAIATVIKGKLTTI